MCFLCKRMLISNSTIDMKKIYNAMAFCGIAAFSAAAQQLPNIGFEGEWVDSKPWNSISHTDYSMTDALNRMNEQMELPQDADVRQPQGWIVSNVLGVVQELEDGAGYGALGSTVTGTQVAGHNSEKALKLTNNPNPFMATQIVPAYVSLGTSWATNTLDFSVGFFPINKDGGVFGGMDFTKRPDALLFDYKLEAPEGGTVQKATAMVYAWKGSWSQAEVPGNNSMSTETVKVDMTDRDRNILGMETSQGGAITKTDDAELIANSLAYIEEATSDWKTYTLPIEYLTSSTPAKINVVLSANDYFDSENIVSGNSLTVDNIRFAYYSRLQGVKLNGVAVADFTPDVFDYEFTGAVPTAAQVETVLLGEGQSANSKVDIDGNTVKITVTNPNGEDTDGLSEHVYTITCKESTNNITINGYLTIKMNGGSLAEDQPATITLQPTAENVYTITLPDFSLDLGGGPVLLGDIVVPDVSATETAGITTYTGEVKDMSLYEGRITADVNLTGTTDASGKADFNIQVLWNNLPIDVTFTGNVAGINNIKVDAASEPEEYFNLNGQRVAGDITPGIYIRRQGNNIAKVIIR